ncbi:class I SAM-dependent methyltransferase [Roseococcus sp. SDR]|uniref:class I SAM-dependent methyltransferase n=1 Tax=Roseococcus sp. SDR TaxID=2835532 RepID=UPI001BCE6429|nr:methyltransferase domain-containing protein [Roseococcus sp. SDR]MBS7793115.1 methyltransferase domain-containing protein [Roseococcus sp. SDR]MBV1848429.1 class I SAM-dependent methyltransferase [Roseococcus sp. SDR]
MMERNSWLLDGLVPGRSRILEIGPSFSPVAAKRHGWNTTIVDHCDRGELISKYGSVGSLDVDSIEDVDIVWRGNSLADQMSSAELGSYDAIIASHVIEHMPDPLAFLRDAERILAPNGTVILAVPDKRLCFDCLRPFSTTGAILEAHQQRRSRHPASAVFDALSWDVRPEDGVPSWEHRRAFVPGFLRDFVEAGQHFEVASRADAPYMDVHGWVFTPASFELLMLELRQMAACAWAVAQIKRRASLEFLVKLRRNSPPLSGDSFMRERVRLSIELLRDLRDGVNWILEGTDAVRVSDQDGDSRRIVEKLIHLNKALGV